MIVVEPEHSLPHVDGEFYLGQIETYTKQMSGTPGPRDFTPSACCVSRRPMSS